MKQEWRRYTYPGHTDQWFGPETNGYDPCVESDTEPTDAQKAAAIAACKNTKEPSCEFNH